MEPYLETGEATESLSKDSAKFDPPSRPLRKLFQFGGGPHITTRNSNTWDTTQKYNSFQYAGTTSSDPNTLAQGNAFQWKQDQSSFGYGPKLGSRWKNGKGFVWGDRRCRYRCVRNTRWSKHLSAKDVLRLGASTEPAVARKQYTGYSHHNSPSSGVRNSIQGSTSYRAYHNSRKSLDTPTNPVITALKEDFETYTSAYDV
eukprot:CAMPEP_0185751638 /NCGR_PEP_ID=MMETSP1174-20130828/10413_1 /TAXON_ID=35687 /ORGANISM="Dictyocha speculum, Strain CCMP1381" /LENGTH=200 /DNA_ID=CAMNT_0028428705 /DNA_START=28 /DNA_END=630 /DNA_ORIENTATION=-